MRTLKASFTVILILVFAIILSSCSSSVKGSQSSITPASPGSEMPISFGTEDTNGRNVIAVYDAIIDPDAKIFSIMQNERSVNYHLPLTQYFQNVLQITGFGFTPNFWADIKINHPFPGSGIDGFDPRVIAIIPANPGVCFNYPALDANSNNSVIQQPDGYTKLFDNLGGVIPGNANPFKAYFKEQPYRRWAANGMTQETQRWQMDIAGFGGPLSFKLVLDVSTNFPNPSLPVVDNAPEPVKINMIVGPGLTPDGGSANITVKLIDWQWQSTIGGVLVEAPDLFSGAINLAYTAPGPNPNEYIYTGIITNSLLAPEGEYKILIAAKDQETGIFLYMEFSTDVGFVLLDGDLMWAKRAGGVSNDMGYGIATLSDDSTVVTGYFAGTATFGQNEINQTTLTADGLGDIFVARYNADGTLAWVKRAGGTTEFWDPSYAITALTDDSVVVTGSYWGAANFGRGEINQTNLTATGKRDMFIARFSPDGTLVWAKSAGGAEKEEGRSITALSDNSSVVTGWFEGTATFGKNEINQTILTSNGDRDLFVAKYNSNGLLEWAKKAGSTNSDYGYGITSLSNNTSAVTGCFYGSVTFGMGEPNQTVLNSAGVWDIFIACYNPNGTLAWVKCAGGTNDEVGLGITSLTDNSIVSTGWFWGPTTFGSGEPNQTILNSTGELDLYIACYNSNGTLRWVKRAGGTSNDYGVGVTATQDNTMLVTGYFYELAVFGLGEVNETTLISSGDADIFIANYDSNGMLTWVKRAGGLGEDCGYSITPLWNNYSVATGYFASSATFGPDEANETILNSAGGLDMFISQFEP
jgi:hypothetical protein